MKVFTLVAVPFGVVTEVKNHMEVKFLVQNLIKEHKLSFGDWGNVFVEMEDIHSKVMESFPVSFTGLTCEEDLGTHYYFNRGALTEAYPL